MGKHFTVTVQSQLSCTLLTDLNNEATPNQMLKTPPKKAIKTSNESNMMCITWTLAFVQGQCS